MCGCDGGAVVVVEGVCMWCAGVVEGACVAAVVVVVERVCVYGGMYVWW